MSAVAKGVSSDGKRLTACTQTQTITDTRIADANADE